MELPSSRADQADCSSACYRKVSLCAWPETRLLFAALTDPTCM